MGEVRRRRLRVSSAWNHSLTPSVHFGRAHWPAAALPLCGRSPLSQSSRCCSYGGALFVDSTVGASLEMEAQTKVQLLQYATTSILFADRGVDTNIIAFNRVILLYGPPGYAAYY